MGRSLSVALAWLLWVGTWSLWVGGSFAVGRSLYGSVSVGQSLWIAVGRSLSGSVALGRSLYVAVGRLLWVAG